MKKIIIMVFLLMPLLLNAQSGGGIKFSNAKNWREVLAQAKLENKKIFVDLYASWCGPCKMMDKDVYSKQEVGDLVNANFIAVRVQMDSTKADDEFVKGWRADAANWKVYVDAYPSFVFYSSEGVYSGKFQGYQNVEDFMVILSRVLDPKGSYLSKLREFEKGSLNEVGLRKLAFWAYENKDTIAYRIGKVYKTKYFDKKSINEKLVPESLPFFGGFARLFRLDEPVIKYMYANQEDAEKSLNAYKGWVSGYIDFLIQRVMLLDKNGKAIVGEPDWKSIENRFAKMFDPKTAKRAVLAKRIYFEAMRGNWNEQAKYEFEQVEFRGLNTEDYLSMMTVNDMIWDVVFTKVTKTEILKKAIRYMEVILKAKPDNYHFRDTYANLLYKAGMKDSGIENQQRSLLLAKKAEDADAIKSYEQRLSKMLSNQPTW